MTTTSTSSATSKLVTALGGGTGIDMVALAENLAAAQFAAKTDRLASQSDKLDKEISSASSIKSMLVNLSASLGSRVRTGDLSPQPTTTNPSSLGGSISKYTKMKAKIGEDQTSLAAKQDALRTQLVARFAKLNAGVGQSKSTLSFLQNQIAAWNGSRN